MPPGTRTFTLNAPWQPQVSGAIQLCEAVEAAAAVKLREEAVSADAVAVMLQSFLKVCVRYMHGRGGACDAMRVVALWLRPVCALA